ncbi:MAG TPA: protein kinase [Casimicrobiaceae bacterium]|nr:protein kinase [Casimicrobiaceae bacterium]
MEKLGRYEIREIVGEGAMARVYKAYDPEIDRTLAVKLLKAQLADDDQYRLRFLREARAAGVLSHPNIVTIFDVGVDGKHPYIAMEMIDGMTLGDLLRTDNQLSVKEIVEIGIQLTRALDYAHKKGIIHRDIKPGNIMLVSETHAVKVADFGICRMDDPDGGEQNQQTQLGDVLGTPNYMSPEQVLGQKIDSRSDLFSVGVVMYKLLTNALPFEGDSVISVAYKIAKSEAPPVQTLRPEIPLTLRRIVERALKKQPEKRFQTGEEFAQALIGVARELNEEESKKGTGRIPLGIRWALMMAALVAVTMAVTGTFLYQRQYAAMMDQVQDYGGSLAKFIATQSAVPLLDEDWTSLDVFIQETLGRQDFNYITIVDHQGQVRGSNLAEQLNQKYSPPNAKQISAGTAEVKVGSHRIADGRDVLDFGTPILFQGKEIGQVHLGIYEAPLSKVANFMLAMLAILTLVTVAAVGGGTYLLARGLAAPMRVLRNSLDELANGRYDYRINDQRKDELGELYAEFDRTAAALEARHDPPKPGDAPPSASHDETMAIPAANMAPKKG